MTVLVVEDDENDIFLFRHAFDKAGLPHLLLLDLKMPKMDGFEVLSWLRRQPAFLKLPVVVWSSSVLENDKNKALSLGAKEFFPKPSSAEEWVRFACELDGRWLTGSI